jgi:hypothetical protein
MTSLRLSGQFKQREKYETFKQWFLELVTINYLIFPFISIDSPKSLIAKSC